MITKQEQDFLLFSLFRKKTYKKKKKTNAQDNELIVIFDFKNVISLLEAEVNIYS